MPNLRKAWMDMAAFYTNLLNSMCIQVVQWYNYTPHAEYRRIIEEYMRTTCISKI